MIFSFLTPENINEKYLAAKEYTRTLTEHFQEYERIAQNKPKDNIPDGYPRVTDGTTASIIRKTPKRIIQQLPTGKVESDNDHLWLNPVAEFVYTHKILPYANEEYDLIQKCWNMNENGLAFGGQAIYTPFVSRDGHFTSDMVLPYWADIFIQPGKKSGYSCSYVFLRSWWQEEDIDALIDREKQLMKSAKERGEKYESDWDMKALEAIKDLATSKTDDEQSPHERNLGLNPSGIEIVTGFQVGVKSKFYTFHPSSTGKDEDVHVVRTKINKDPRGKMPIDWFYADIDGENPLGRGIIDLLKGVQNLIDSDMQAYQYNRALMLQPPLIKTGSFSKRKIMYRPNAIIDLGTDQNASIKTLDVDTSAVINYPDLYGLQKSQILNLVSSPDTSISAEVGNPGFGKTPTAIDQQKSTISIDDNYQRKMFEAAYEHWSETAINLYFAERSGTEELQLDKKTSEELRKLADEGKFDLNLLTDDDVLTLDYDQATPALTFRVDASTSKMKDDSEQGQILTDLIKGVDSSPTLSGLLAQHPDKALEMWNKLIESVGLEDPEKLKFDVDQMMQQMQAEQQMMAEQQAMQAQMPQQMPADPSMMQPQDQQMLPMPQQQPEMPAPSPMDGLSQDNPLGMIYQSLIEQGVPEELASDATDMAAQGATPDEVMAALQEVMSGR